MINDRIIELAAELAERLGRPVFIVRDELGDLDIAESAEPLPQMSADFGAIRFHQSEILAQVDESGFVS